MKKIRVLKFVGTPRVDGPIQTKCHQIGGDTNEVRFTYHNGEIRKLAAVVHSGRFTWVHKDFIGSFA